MRLTKEQRTSIEERVEKLKALAADPSSPEPERASALRRVQKLQKDLVPHKSASQEDYDQMRRERRTEAKRTRQREKEAFEQILAAALTAITSAFGGKRRLRKTFRPEEIKSLQADTYQIWLEEHALKFGYDGRNPQPFEMTSDLQASFKDAANVVRAQRRAAAEAEVSAEDMLGFEFRDTYDAEAEAADQESKARAETLIEEAFKDVHPVYRTVYSMHQGLSAIPGQPAALLGNKPMENFRAYHRAGSPRNEVCPTCRVISRFVRHPGFDEEKIGQIIDNLTAKIAVLA